MILERESARDVDPSDGAGKSVETSTALLTEIRDLLDRQQRASLHDDFSIRRLLATLIQMVALVIAGWALYALFTGDAPAALTRLALAGFLQLIMMTLAISDLRR